MKRTILISQPSLSLINLKNGFTIRKFLLRISIYLILISVTLIFGSCIKQFKATNEVRNKIKSELKYPSTYNEKQVKIHERADGLIRYDVVYRYENIDGQLFNGWKTYYVQVRKNGIIIDKATEIEQQIGNPFDDLNAGEAAKKILNDSKKMMSDIIEEKFGNLNFDSKFLKEMKDDTYNELFWSVYENRELTTSIIPPT